MTYKGGWGVVDGRYKDVQRNGYSVENKMIRNDIENVEYVTREVVSRSGMTGVTEQE